MVRDSRIKEVQFATFTVNGSVASNTYTSHPINGEILKVRFQGNTSPGSFWLSESGTNLEFYRRNDLTSGLASFEAYPVVAPVDNTNTTVSGTNTLVVTNRVVNSPIFYAASGLTSGTSKTFGPITVFYR